MVGLDPSRSFLTAALQGQSHHDGNDGDQDERSERPHLDDGIEDAVDSQHLSRLVFVGPGLACNMALAAVLGVGVPFIASDSASGQASRAG